MGRKATARLRYWLEIIFKLPQSPIVFNFSKMLTIINYKRNKRLQLDAITHSLSFPDGSAGKESACSAGDTGNVSLIPGSGRTLEEETATHSSILA